MRPNYPGKPLYSAICLFLFFAAIDLCACGHTNAATPDLQPDAVMQTIREYAHGHQPSPPPTNAAKPEETDEHYCATIHKLLLQEDFAQLEKIARQDRMDQGRLIAGIWKINAFYSGTGWPSCTGDGPDAAFTSQISILKKWSKANPDSPTPRLSLAGLYLNYAWSARGNGLANTVAEDGWKLYYERTAQAKAILLEAAPLKEKDPKWFELMQVVAHQEGWEPAEARELFNLAVAFQPGYLHYYRHYARYLEPQWYGQSGDLQAFAEEVAEHTPEPEGSMYYFLISSSFACYCELSLRAMQSLSYPKIRDGYNHLASLYGVSNLNANRFALIASVFNDKDSARQAFTAITQVDDNIWIYEQTFDDRRQWATSP